MGFSTVRLAMPRLMFSQSLLSGSPFSRDYQANATQTNSQEKRDKGNDKTLLDKWVLESEFKLMCAGFKGDASESKVGL